MDRQTDRQRQNISKGVTVNCTTQTKEGNSTTGLMYSYAPTTLAHTHKHRRYCTHKRKKVRRRSTFMWSLNSLAKCFGQFEDKSGPISNKVCLRNPRLPLYARKGFPPWSPPSFLNQGLTCDVWYTDTTQRSRTLVDCLLNVKATCLCISGTDLFRQFYVLPHWDRRCRYNFVSHPVTVY